MVIQNLDKQTSESCLSVSRSFRDYASDVFFMGGNLRLETRSNGALECFHPEAGFLGPFRPTYDGVIEEGDVRFKEAFYNSALHGPIRNTILEPHSDHKMWFPILGLQESDNTPSYAGNIILWFPKLRKWPCRPITSQPLTRRKTQYLDSCALSYAFYVQQGQSFRRNFEYELFEEFLPLRVTVASSADVFRLYAIAIFRKFSIVGPRKELFYPYCNADCELGYIPRTPLNTYMRIHRRRNNKGQEQAYALSWAKQPCEDTHDGWRRAQNEAMHQASDEWLSQLYTWWAKGSILL